MDQNDIADLWKNTVQELQCRISFLLIDDDFEARVVPRLTWEKDPFEGGQSGLTYKPSTKYMISWPDMNKMIKPQLEMYLRSLQDLFFYMTKGKTELEDPAEYIFQKKDDEVLGNLYCVLRIRDRTRPELGYRPLPPSNFWSLLDGAPLRGGCSPLARQGGRRKRVLAMRSVVFGDTVITTGQPLSTMVSPEDEAAEADDPAKHENRSHRSPTTRREVDQAVEQPIAQPQEQLSQPQEQSAPTNEKPRRRFTELRYRTLNLPTLPEEHTNQDLKDWYTKLFKEDPMRYCPHDRKRLANEQRRCFNLVWDKSFAKEEEDLLDGFDSDDYDDDLSTQGNTNTDSDDYDNDDGNILDPVKLPRIFDIAIERLPRVIPNNASVITGNAENWLYLQKAERDLTLSEAQRDILKKANKEAKSELWKLAEKLIIRFHALYGVRQRKEFADCLSFMEWVLDYHSEQQQEVEEEQNNLEVLGNDIQSSRKELYILEFIMEEALIINNLAKVHQFVVTNGIEDIEAGKLLPKFIKRAEASYDF